MSKPDPIEAIERDLSESRSNLKENVHALSEKLTLGKIVDELVFDSKINWGSVGGKTADTMKSVLPAMSAFCTTSHRHSGCTSTFTPGICRRAWSTCSGRNN